MTTATKPKEDDDNNNNGSDTIGRRDSVHMTEALQRKTIIDELDGDTTLIMNVIQRAGMTSEHTNQNPGEGSAGLHRKKMVLDHMTQQLLTCHSVLLWAAKSNILIISHGRNPNILQYRWFSWFV